MLIVWEILCKWKNILRSGLLFGEGVWTAIQFYPTASADSCKRGFNHSCNFETEKNFKYLLIAKYETCLFFLSGSSGSQPQISNIQYRCLCYHLLQEDHKWLRAFLKCTPKKINEHVQCCTSVLIFDPFIHPKLSDSNFGQLSITDIKIYKYTNHSSCFCINKVVDVIKLISLFTKIMPIV